MAATISYKKGHTIRNEGRVWGFVANVRGPLDLTDKTLEVNIVKQGGTTPLRKTIGSGVELGAVPGQFFWDVSDADLTALGCDVGDGVDTTFNVKRADNTLAATGTGLVTVRL